MDKFTFATIALAAAVSLFNGPAHAAKMPGKDNPQATQENAPQVPLFQCPDSDLKLNPRNLTVGELEGECIEIEGEIEDQDITDSGVGCTDDCLVAVDEDGTKLYWVNGQLYDTDREELERAAAENECERDACADDAENDF